MSAILTARPIGSGGGLDPLTGLPDRASFERRLRSALGDAGSILRDSLAVFFVDLDGFKAIVSFAGETSRLFHLEDDAGESVDLAVSDPGRLRTLEELVRAHKEEALALYRKIGSGSQGEEVVLSPQERERLEAFGYTVHE